MKKYILCSNKRNILGSTARRTGVTGQLKQTKPTAVIHVGLTSAAVSCSTSAIFVLAVSIIHVVFT
jgi:hypothetical protein